MPNATARANARPTPKSASGPNAEVTTLADRRPPPARDAPDWRHAYFQMEETVNDVRIWSSIGQRMSDNLAVPITSDDLLSLSCLARVIERLSEAAADMFQAYHDGNKSCGVDAHEDKTAEAAGAA